MKVYTFILTDDFTGWDITDTFVSDQNKEIIESLWNITKGKCYIDKLSFIKNAVKSLGGVFEPLIVEENFLCKK